MTEESFIDFKCPHCSETVSFPEGCAGRAQECPMCADTVIVPRDGSGLGRELPLPLTTPRLTLRRLSGLDWKDLQECLSDEELFRYEEGRPLDEEEITRWLEADSYVKLTTLNQVFCLGIEVTESSKLIGYLSLNFIDSRRLQAAVNILLNRGFQRKGFGTEAVGAALGLCFAGIGLHRVAAHCDSRNTAACRLLEKVGLRREGEFLKDRFVNGEWVNTVWYAMLSEDYTKSGNRLS